MEKIADSHHQAGQINVADERGEVALPDLRCWLSPGYLHQDRTVSNGNHFETGESPPAELKMVLSWGCLALDVDCPLSTQHH
jgi:hypothetical protein